MKGYWNKPEATKEAIVDGGFRPAMQAISTKTDSYTFMTESKI